MSVRSLFRVPEKCGVCATCIAHHDDLEQLFIVQDQGWDVILAGGPYYQLN
jgi:hypothetical protein